MERRQAGGGGGGHGVGPLFHQRADDLEHELNSLQQTGWGDPEVDEESEEPARDPEDQALNLSGQTPILSRAHAVQQLALEARRGWDLYNKQVAASASQDALEI